MTKTKAQVAQAYAQCMEESLLWTTCIDNLKESVDRMYDLCYKTRNPMACEDAIMFLENGARDFASLINAMRVENEWADLENLPASSVSWEVKGNTTRGTNSTTNANKTTCSVSSTVSLMNGFSSSEEMKQQNTLIQEKEKPTKTGNETINGNYSSIKEKEKMDEESTEVEGNRNVCTNGITSQAGFSGTVEEDMDYIPNEVFDSSLSPVKKHSPEKEGEWQVVNRGKFKRRRTIETERPSREKMENSVHKGRYSAPKCAMDLPQTKSSMVKIAHSRSLMWEQTKKKFDERINERRRKEFRQQIAANVTNRSTNSSKTDSNSETATSKQTTNGHQQPRERIESDSDKGSNLIPPNCTQPSHKINSNFTKPIRIPHNEGQKARKHQIYGNNRRSVRSLERINEDDQSHEESGSATRTPTKTRHSLPPPSVTQEENSGNLTDSNSPPDESNQQQQMEKVFDDFSIENDGTNGELPSYLKCLDDDVEWRSLTQEEESLTQEEESLKREIEEEESFSFTDEQIEHLDTDIIEGEAARDEAKTPPANEVKTDTQTENPEQKPVQNFISTAAPIRYRIPGKLAQLRAKLLSPSKRSYSNNMDPAKRQERAQRLREILFEERAAKLKELHVRVDEVRKKREEIQLRKAEHLDVMQERVQNAEKMRQRNIEEIVRRAKDDDMKVMEINFIKTLEAENVKFEKQDLQVREETKHKNRLSTMAEKRQRKIEEKCAKEVAAEQRRKTAEEQRQQKVQDEASKRTERRNEAELRRGQKTDKVRNQLEQHEQKVKQRKLKEELESKELMSKIQQKQERGTEIHESRLEDIKRRAAMGASPRPLTSWTQLADFAQIPSDQMYVEIAGTASTAAEGENKNDVTGNDTLQSQTDVSNNRVLKCIRCEILLHSDLHLVSHILSAEHLEKCGDVLPMPSESDDHTILVSEHLTYEFFKSELDTEIQEAVVSDAIPIAETTNGDSIDNAHANGLPSPGASTPISNPIKSTASKKNKQHRQKLVKRLLTPPLKHEHASEQQCRNILADAGILSPTSSGNPKFDKKVRELVVALDKLRPIENAPATRPDSEALQKLDRGLLELLKIFQQNSGIDRQRMRRAVVNSDMLTPLCVFLASQRLANKSAGNSSANASSMTNAHPSLQEQRIFTKTMNLLAEILGNFRPATTLSQGPNADLTSDQIAHDLLSNGNYLVAFCDLFHQKAQKSFSSNPESTSNPTIEKIYFIPAMQLLFILNRNLFSRTKPSQYGIVSYIERLHAIYTYLFSACGGLTFLANSVANILDPLLNSPNFEWPNNQTPGNDPASNVSATRPIELFSTLIVNYARFAQISNRFPQAAAIREAMSCHQMPSLSLPTSITGAINNAKTMNDPTSKIVGNVELESLPVIVLVTWFYPFVMLLYRHFLHRRLRSAVEQQQSPQHQLDSSQSDSSQIDDSATNAGDTSNTNIRRDGVENGVSTEQQEQKLLKTKQVAAGDDTLPVKNRTTPAACEGVGTFDSNAIIDGQLEPEEVFTIYECFMRTWNGLFEIQAILCSQRDRQFHFDDQQSNQIAQFLFNLEPHGQFTIRLAFLLQELYQTFIQSLPKTALRALCQLNPPKAVTRIEQQLIDNRRMRAGEAFTAIGYFAMQGDKTKLLCCIGWQRSLLAMIVGLPFDFFLSDLFKHSVTPVLIAILHRSPMALDIIQSEFDRNHVVSYLKEAQKAVSQGSEKSPTRMELRRFYGYLTRLFAIPKWSALTAYFQRPVESV